MELTTIVLGFVVGIVVGMTSTGGGVLLTPALLLLGVRPSLAVGSDVLAASVMKLAGSASYLRRRAVHLPTVGRLAVGSIPGAVLGIMVMNQLPGGFLDAVLRRAIGGVLVVAGGVTIARLLLPPAASRRRIPSAGATAAMGFATGLLVSMTSIGSGSILLSMLVLFFPMGAQVAVGTDLVHAVALSSVATVGHLLSGRVDLGLGLTIIAGGIPGVLVGARLATRVPERTLRIGLATLLIAMGLHLTFEELRRPEPPDGTPGAYVESRHG